MFQKFLGLLFSGFILQFLRAIYCNCLPFETVPRQVCLWSTWLRAGNPSRRCFRSDIALSSISFMSPLISSISSSDFRKRTSKNLFPEKRKQHTTVKRKTQALVKKTHLVFPNKYFYHLKLFLDNFVNRTSVYLLWIDTHFLSLTNCWIFPFDRFDANMCRCPICLGVIALRQKAIVAETPVRSSSSLQIR